MQSVDHGLCLVEADGVGCEGLYDRGERLLDGPWTVDVRKRLQIEVWVAGMVCGFCADGRDGDSSNSPGREALDCHIDDRPA